MKELKGIKLEDLNVTKETFIKLIGLLNLDLELPDDERIIFDEEIEKFESGQVIAFYHLLVYGDNLYNFCLSFFLSSLTGNSFHLSGYNVDTCNFSMHNLLDCLYESCILTPVEEEDNPEQTPAEDAEEQSEMIDTNMGAMPIEDYHDILAYQHGFDSYEEFKKAWCSDSEPELTPLERIIFRERDTCIERYSLFSEKAEEAENDDEYDNYRFDASVAIRIADYLEYIIMEVGLTEKWYSWLEARQKARKGG